MAEYVTTTDQNVALNGVIPFNSVSIPCNTGSVVTVAPGILNLKGNMTNWIPWVISPPIPSDGQKTWTKSLFCPLARPNPDFILRDYPVSARTFPP